MLPDPGWELRAARDPAPGTGPFPFRSAFSDLAEASGDPSPAEAPAGNQAPLAEPPATPAGPASALLSYGLLVEEIEGEIVIGLTRGQGVNRRRAMTDELVAAPNLDM